MQSTQQNVLSLSEDVIEINAHPSRQPHKSTNQRQARFVEDFDAPFRPSPSIHRAIHLKAPATQLSLSASLPPSKDSLDPHKYQSRPHMLERAETSDPSNEKARQHCTTREFSDFLPAHSVRTWEELDVDTSQRSKGVNKLAAKGIHKVKKRTIEAASRLEDAVHDMRSRSK